MGLAPAPTGAFPLAWVALVPLWILVATGRTKLALCGAIAWGCGYYGVAIFWITGIHPMTWLGVPWLGSLAIAVACWLLIILWGALFVVLWAIGMILLNRSKGLWHGPGARILTGVALWCGLEALWSAGPLWWTSLSYTQSPGNLAILQLAKLSGPSAVTAAIAAVNGLAAEFAIARFATVKVPGWATTRNPYTYLAAALALIASLHGLGGWIYGLPLSDRDPIQVGIIQGNIPNEIKLFREGQRRAMQRYTEGYVRLADLGVDAVLTPEGALPLLSDQLQDTPFYSAVADKGVLVWLGAYREREATGIELNYSNSLFSISGTGEITSYFDKEKLVPLGEYIPFESVLGGIINRLSPLNARMLAGNSSQIFETPLGRAIVGICYESAFPQHFRRQTLRGGEFILTASNNAHYSTTMPAQHHAQDVMRAIESDRWAARATNTGYSGVVDSRGNTLWVSGINTYEVQAATIYRRQTQTPYVRWGDWLTWSAIAIVLANQIAARIVVQSSE